MVKIATLVQVRKIAQIAFKVTFYSKGNVRKLVKTDISLIKFCKNVLVNIIFLPQNVTVNAKLAQVWAANLARNRPLTSTLTTV